LAGDLKRWRKDACYVFAARKGEKVFFRKE